LPNELRRIVFDPVPPQQREALVVAIGAYGCMALLVWSCLSSACSGALAVAAYGRACACVAPAARAAHALQTVATLRLFEPVLLPIKALCFVVAVPNYHRVTLALQRRLGARRWPQLVAVLATYAVGMASVAACTAAGLAGVALAFG